jgi:uncharacterized membrane protein
MNGKTIGFLIAWIFLVADSTGGVLCKQIQACRNMFLKYLPVSKNFGLDNAWVYFYWVLAIFGLVTVIMMRSDATKSTQMEQYKLDRETK